jgi:hypothetical protein
VQGYSEASAPVAAWAAARVDRYYEGYIERVGCGIGGLGSSEGDPDGDGEAEAAALDNDGAALSSTTTTIVSNLF